MKTMRCRNFFRLMTICNLCQVARNMYTEVWWGHFGDTMCVPILDNSKLQYNKTKAAKIHRSIISNSLYSFLLVDVYRIAIVESHISILLHWP